MAANTTAHVSHAPTTTNPYPRLPLPPRTPSQPTPSPYDGEFCSEIQDSERIGQLERAYCRNFICCGHWHADLHALMQHLELVHQKVEPASGAVIHTPPQAANDSIRSAVAALPSSTPTPASGANVGTYPYPSLGSGTSAAAYTISHPQYYAPLTFDDSKIPADYSKFTYTTPFDELSSLLESAAPADWFGWSTGVDEFTLDYSSVNEAIMSQLPSPVLENSPSPLSTPSLSNSPYNSDYDGSSSPYSSWSSPPTPGLLHSSPASSASSTPPRTPDSRDWARPYAGSEFGASKAKQRYASMGLEPSLSSKRKRSSHHHQQALADDGDWADSRAGVGRKTTKKSHAHAISRVDAELGDGALGGSFSKQVASASGRDAIVIDSSALSGASSVSPNRRKDRERPFKCHVPGCTKEYLNPNGLKYHLERGTCTIDLNLVTPEIRVAIEQAQASGTRLSLAAGGIIAAAAASSSSSASSTPSPSSSPTTTPPSSVVPSAESSPSPSSPAASSSPAPSPLPLSPTSPHSALVTIESLSSYKYETD
ncbi:hypothetical protein AX16_004912 [Volvariella volvacea WC 439]|nr:hypothetical protein AX16_004912 [Volvariella volvacea WC 439]